MARKKKFTQPGETEQKIRWNKAKTRKWLTEYTVLVVRPKKTNKRKSKKAVSEEKPKQKSKKATKSKKAKPAKHKTKAVKEKG